MKQRRIFGRALSFALLLTLLGAPSGAGPRVSLDIRNSTARTPANDSDINAAKAKLLAQVKRPIVKDVLDAFGGSLPLENPFHPIGADARIGKLMSLGPEMIAQFEFAFPGAIWSPLGRDSGVVGDILEAYYETKGIHDRIVRLDASTASFTEPGLELKFLYSAGLIPSPDAEAERKFVILDPTSWSVDNFGNPVSQIRKIISAYYRKHGGFRTLGFVNAIGLGTSGRGNMKGPQIAPTVSIDHFWASMTFKPAEPTQILYSFPDFAYLNLAPGSQAEISWHDSFLKFIETPSGGVVAPPGNPSSQANREHILWMSYEIIKAVRTAEFQRSVSERAAAYGFNIERVLETDFNVLENNRRFQTFAHQRRWQQGDIEEWRKSTFDGLPNSTSTLAKLRSLELIAIGVEQGDIADSALQETWKTVVAASAKNPVLADSIADLILSKGNMKGRKALLTALESPVVQAEKAGLDAIIVSPTARANIEKLPKALTGEPGRLVNAMIADVGSVKTIDGIIARMREVLAYATTPADYLRVLQYHIPNPSDTYKVHLEKFVLAQLDAFIAAGATIADLKRLESQAVWNIKERLDVMRRGLDMVRTPADYLALTAFTINNPSDAYKQEMGAFAAQNIDVAINNGATIVELKEIEKQRCYYVKDLMTIAKKGMALVRSREDFRFLTQFAFPTQSDEYKREMTTFIHMNPDYANHNVKSVVQLKQRLGEMTDSNAILVNLIWGLRLVQDAEDFVELMRPPEALGQRFQSTYEQFLIADGGDKLIQLNPSVTHVDAVLQMFQSSRRAFLIAAHLLPNASSPEVYISVMKFALSIGSRTTPNTAQLVSLAKTNLAVFTSLHPSAENVEELRRLLRSRLKYDLQIPAGQASAGRTEATIKKMSLWDRTKATVVQKFQSGKSCKTSLLPKSGD